MPAWQYWLMGALLIVMAGQAVATDSFPTTTIGTASTGIEEGSTESTDLVRDEAGRLVVHISNTTGRLLSGAELPPPADLTALDCEALYERRLALYRQNLTTKPDLLDDPRTQAAMFIGTIWTPAFLYLPYAAAERYLDQIERIERTAEINDLAYASSAQDCFME